MKDVLIVGCGDIGRRVARLEQGRGARVSATCRRPEQAPELARLGLEPVIADFD
ncbi:MAG: SDR family NAD(P)-dependent oxidoreductase, partial [Desulfuromonadales bacterium]|nr:SDR family NAD(P)-dependent oxidoreductase [Desulfuromonadales bacterium]